MTKILKLVNDCADDCPHAAYEAGGYCCRKTMQRGPWRNERMERMRRIPCTFDHGKALVPVPDWCPLPDYPCGVKPSEASGCTYPHCSGDKPEDGGCCGGAVPCKPHGLIACVECAFGVTEVPRG